MIETLYRGQNIPDIPNFLESIKKSNDFLFDYIDILPVVAKYEFETFKISFDHFLPYLAYDHDNLFDQYSFEVFKTLLLNGDKRGFFYFYKHVFKLNYLEDELIISNINAEELIRTIDLNDVYINIFNKYLTQDTEQLIHIFKLIKENLNIPFSHSYYHIKDQHINFLMICLNKIKSGRLNLIPLLYYYDQGAEPTFFKFYYNDRRNNKYILDDIKKKFTSLFLNFSHIIMKDKSQGLRALSEYKEWEQISNKFFKHIPKELLLSDVDNIIFSLNEFFSKKYNTMIFNGHDFKVIAQKLIIHFTTASSGNDNHITDVLERLIKIFNAEPRLIVDSIDEAYNSIYFKSYLEKDNINKYNKHIIDLLFIKHEKLMLNQLKDSQQNDLTEKRKRL